VEVEAEAEVEVGSKLIATVGTGGVTRFGVTARQFGFKSLHSLGNVST